MQRPGASNLDRILGGRFQGLIRTLAAPSAGGGGRLTDIETRRLSPQASVSVFRCDGRSFMVATSAQGQIVLVSLDTEESHGDGA